MVNPRRTSRVSQRALATTAALGGVFLLGLFALPSTHPPLSVEEQAALDRYRRIQSALHAARAERLDSPALHRVEGFDPARTGLIGDEWSYLVTTPGNLDAKQASAHPVWVLMFLEWFREARLRPGDVVAVGCSASFPALLYSLRAAAESRGLRVRAVASLTASNHGATIPEFDLWDMEEVVLRRGLLAPGIVALTPGGLNDAADYLGEEETQRLRARLAAIAGRPDAPEVLWPASFAEALTLRERLLLGGKESGLPPASTLSASLFVNIGGNSANVGLGQTALLLPHGYIPAHSYPAASDGKALPRGHGLIHVALARGLPAIHLLDVRSLLAARGIAVGAMSGDAGAAFRSLGRASAPARILASVIALGIIILLFILPRETPRAERLPFAKEH